MTYLVIDDDDTLAWMDDCARADIESFCKTVSTDSGEWLDANQVEHGWQAAVRPAIGWALRRSFLILHEAHGNLVRINLDHFNKEEKVA